LDERGSYIGGGTSGKKRMDFFLKFIGNLVGTYSWPKGGPFWDNGKNFAGKGLFLKTGGKNPHCCVPHFSRDLRGHKFGDTKSFPRVRTFKRGGVIQKGCG